MDGIIESVKNGGTLSQAFFLMVCGMGFVFSVQVVFYFVIALWPKAGKE